MPRPRLRRHIRAKLQSRFYKPQGVPMRELETIILTAEEMEALRLKHIKKLAQTECAKKMKTSQSTFQRILSKAHEKMTTALVNGYAINFNPNENESS